MAEAAARLGAAVVADHFGGLTAGVYSKAPGDYVSEVDLASEETIREALERDAPGIAFFGEEGGGTKGDLWWVVDPLDGTANFLHGFPVVGVSVALVEAGRPVAGAVHAPLLGGETFTAVRGGGAFRDGRPIRVADRPAASAICTTGFPFKKKHRLDEYRRVFEGAFLALRGPPPGRRRQPRPGLDGGRRLRRLLRDRPRLLGRRRRRPPGHRGRRGRHRLGRRRRGLAGQRRHPRRPPAVHQVLLDLASGNGP